ncbi:MAG: exodeoxyribonuclease VII small subunit [Candidatus Latescibacteria bacterium]|nr:exodeoxyribonuclease VII small subunit [bacterium]MBD3423694.1 exodeoxyribonuclease VII small subunit [Candidatus Latescibacterota bacterium]
MNKKEDSFEGSMKRLEEIVSRLENENVPLEESISLYEEGVRIGKRCREILDRADSKIKELSGERKRGSGKSEKDEK